MHMPRQIASAVLKLVEHAAQINIADMKQHPTATPY